MIPNLIEVYAVIILGILSFVATYLTVYNYKISLSKLNVFNRKPFTCWLCSNWWLSWFLWLNLAYIWDVWFLLWGGVFTLMTTYVIWADPNP